MTEPEESQEPSERGFDLVTVLYILGGIPTIVAIIVILFTLVNLAPGIPA